MAKKKQKKKATMKVGQTKIINTPRGKRKIKKFKNGKVRIVPRKR